MEILVRYTDALRHLRIVIAPSPHGGVVRRIDAHPFVRPRVQAIARAAQREAPRAGGVPPHVCYRARLLQDRPQARVEGLGRPWEGEDEQCGWHRFDASEE